MTPKWARQVTQGVELDVWVVPGASRTELGGTHAGALRIRVAAPPEKGAANRAVARLLRAETGARVEIMRGHAARRKTVLIHGAVIADVVRALARATGGEGRA